MQFDQHGSGITQLAPVGVRGKLLRPAKGIG